MDYKEKETTFGVDSELFGSWLLFVWDVRMFGFCSRNVWKFRERSNLPMSLELYSMAYLKEGFNNNLHPANNTKEHKQQHSTERSKQWTIHIILSNKKDNNIMLPIRSNNIAWIIPKQSHPQNKQHQFTKKQPIRRACYSTSWFESGSCGLSSNWFTPWKSYGCAAKWVSCWVFGKLKS